MRCDSGLVVLILSLGCFALGGVAGYQYGHDQGCYHEQQRAEDAGAGKFERDERTGQRQFRYKDRRILPWVP